MKVIIADFKALVPLIMTALYAIATATTGNVGASNWKVIIGGILTAIVTYLVPGKPPDLPGAAGKSEVSSS